MKSAFVVVPRGGAAGEADDRSRQRDVPRHPALEPLRRQLVDPAVTDVFVHGGALFVDRGRGAERVAGWSMSPEEVRSLAVTMIGIGGRHLDDATPCADVRWDGGARVHAVLPPVARGGATISIRLASVEALSLDELHRSGALDAAVRERLERLVAERRNVLISGATGSGKTTLLSAMLSLVGPRERIVTIEDVAELRLDHPHHVSLESRQPNLEGAGEIPLARLVREALRMRPDRLVVGECRGVEVRELLGALNTGHDGGAGTVHAGGMRDVPARLEALGALVGWDERTVARQVASAIHAVVHVGRGRDGVRRVEAIGVPTLEGGRLAIAQEQR